MIAGLCVNLVCLLRWNPALIKRRARLGKGTKRWDIVWSALYTPLIVVLYVVAMGFIALHLYHGAWSMFQSLGLDSPDRNAKLRALALVLAIGLFAGFVTVPLSFALGVAGARDTATAEVVAPAVSSELPTAGGDE